jgi:hypothetical protein
MNYEKTTKFVSRTATAIVGAHLALIALEVSVMAGSLPNVYVSDSAASCGARNLVSYSAHNILLSGLFAIAAIFIWFVYSAWIEMKDLTFTVVGYTGQTFLFITVCALGITSVAFFLLAWSQLVTLGNPPRIPPASEKTQACPALFATW